VIARKVVKVKKISFFPWIIFSLYAIMQVISYFIFLGKLPSIRLSFVYLGFISVIGVYLLNKILRKGFKIKLSLVQFLSWMLLVWIFVEHLVWFPQIAAAGGKEAFFFTSGQTLVMPMLMWLLGITIGMCFPQSRNSYYVRFLLWISFIALGTCTIYSVLLGYINYHAFQFFFKNYQTGGIFNYLWFGDIVALLGILLMGSFRDKTRIQLSVYFLNAFFLFLNFSRTSFYLFAFIGLVYYFWCKKKSFLKATLSLLIIFFIVFFVLPYLFPSVGNFNFYKRMFSIFSPISENASLTSRLELLQEGLKTPIVVILFGRFMDEWWRTGNTGPYIHNWLSFFASYGLLPFLVSLFIFFDLLIKSNYYLRKLSDPLPMAILGYSILAIILSRAYNWPFIWFSIGFVAYFNRKEGIL